MVSVLSEEDLQGLGLNSIINGKNFDADNPIASSMASSVLPQTDKIGRQIISYKQYLELKKLGARLENYALRMIWPGKNIVNTIQASKLQKWWGLGYRPIGEIQENAKKRKLVPPVQDGAIPEDVDIFWCRDKYPDCGRFFDSQKGLTFHWNRDHGEAPIRKPKTTKVTIAEKDE